MSRVESDENDPVLSYLQNVMTKIMGNVREWTSIEDNDSKLDVSRRGNELNFNFRTDLNRYELQGNNSVTFQHEELCRIEHYIRDSLNDVKYPPSLGVYSISVRVGISFTDNEVAAILNVQHKCKVTSPNH